MKLIKIIFGILLVLFGIGQGVQLIMTLRQPEVHPTAVLAGIAFTILGLTFGILLLVKAFQTDQENKPGHE